MSKQCIFFKALWQLYDEIAAIVNYNFLPGVFKKNLMKKNYNYLKL